MLGMTGLLPGPCSHQQLVVQVCELLGVARVALQLLPDGPQLILHCVLLIQHQLQPASMI